MTTTSFGEDMASVRESMLLSVGIAGFSSLVVGRGRVGCSRCASSRRFRVVRISLQFSQEFRIVQHCFIFSPSFWFYITVVFPV